MCCKSAFVSVFFILALTVSSCIRGPSLQRMFLNEWERKRSAKGEEVKLLRWMEGGGREEQVSNGGGTKNQHQP